MALSTPTAYGFTQVFKAALVDVDTSPIEPLGTIRYERNSTYKYVKFSGTNAVAIGDALCYVVTDTALLTVDKANSAVGAGVAVTIVAAGTVQYGWIQIQGVATLSTTTGASVGNSLTNVGASAGVLKAIAAHTDPQVAVLNSASAPISVQLDYLP
jgi:hypothetical protein